ncbi:hypothetical protein ABLO16_01475 [Mycobacterium tuberculosis]
MFFAFIVETRVFRAPQKKLLRAEKATANYHGRAGTVAAITE